MARGTVEEGFLKTLSDQRGAMPNYPHIYIMRVCVRVVVFFLSARRAAFVCPSKID